jgi:hypothetical protein
MPSSKNYKRDYDQERKTAIKRGETSVGSKSSDAIRHRARRVVEKSMGRDLPANIHVDHKTPLKDSKRNPNVRSNLQTKSQHENDSAGGKAGNRRGKAAGGRKGK